MRRLRLSVSAMTCRHRVREVTRRLRDVPGVETVSADAGTGTVVLVGTMEDEEVLAVLAETGYDVTVREVAAGS